MKQTYPFVIGLVVGALAVCGYVLGFWFVFAGHSIGFIMFYGGLVIVPLYMVFALAAPWLFSIKNRALGRNWRLSALMVPVGIIALWVFITLRSG